jgi:large subunit ribosomal protein L19
MSEEEKKNEEQPEEKPPVTEEKPAEEKKEETPVETEKKTDSAEETPAEKPAEEEEKGAPVEDAAQIAEQEAQAKQQAEEEAVAAEEIAFPDLRPGMTIRLHQKINEGEKSRIQVFQGIIIAMRGKSPATKTVTLQKKSFGVMVEKIFPLASPMIEKIEVVKIAKVRRAKLNYLRDYSKRLKETLVKKD